MAQRRDRPPVQRSGDSLNVRLGDGRTISVSVDASRGPVTMGVCCFCGQDVTRSGGERISLSARWNDDATERTQSWEAHRACLTERLHDTVKGAGPFFAD
jgi:hypothetical protein